MKQKFKNIIIVAVIFFFFAILVTAYALFLDKQARNLNPAPINGSYLTTD